MRLPFEKSDVLKPTKEPRSVEVVLGWVVAAYGSSEPSLARSQGSCHEDRPKNLLEDAEADSVPQGAPRSQRSLEREE